MLLRVVRGSTQGFSKRRVQILFSTLALTIDQFGREHDLQIEIAAFG